MRIPNLLSRRPRCALFFWRADVSNGELGRDKGRVEMASDDEDFPISYLLYAIAVVVGITVVAISSFLILVR